MTRINLIHPSELCDKHLMAEYRELVRIPNGIVSGRLKSWYPDAPTKYTLGAGHIKFFVSLGSFLYDRHIALYNELKYRRFNVGYIDWSNTYLSLPELCKFGYIPSKDDISLNISRILDRMPPKAKFTLRPYPQYLLNHLAKYA